MAPPKAACQAIADVETAYAEVLAKIAAVRQTIADIFALRLKIRFGIFSSLLDAVGAELVSAAESVAADISQSVMSAVSSASAAVLNAILAPLLKILLSVPTALFSLVAIPRTQCLQYLQDERRYLILAQGNFRMISGILAKWTNTGGGDHYYSQMKQSLPLIQQAIDFCIDIVDELNQDPLVFNQSKYAQLQQNLSAAIDLTKPFNSISSMTGFKQQIESDRSKRYEVLSNAINAKYVIKRNQVTAFYQADMAAIPPNTTVPLLTKGPSAFQKEVGRDRQTIAQLNSGALTNAVKEEKARQTYEQRLANLDTQKTIELARAQTDANEDALIHGSDIAKSLQGVAAEFTYDLQIVTQQLSEFADNMKTAYLRYQGTKLTANTIYRSDALIRGIIQWIIDAMRTINSGAKQGVILPMDGARSMLEIVDEKFTEDISKYEAPDKNISATGLTIDLFLGNQLLTTADAMLDATITSSLIALLNAPNILQDSTGEFDVYIGKIAAIPDWDGATNIWAIDFINAAPAPYIASIADVLSLVSKIASFQSSKQSINNIFQKMDASLTKMIRHNLLVEGVIQSYVPYVGSDAGNITAILSKAGLLTQFASAMSMVGLVDSIISTLPANLDNSVPNHANCQAAYPDMYADPTLSDAAAAIAMNTPSDAVNFDMTAFNESHANDVNAVRIDNNTLNIFPNDDSVYYNSDQATS